MHRWAHLMLLIVSSALAVILIATSHSTSQNLASANQQRSQARTPAQGFDFEDLPLVEYDRKETADLKERAKREAKGRKYNRSESAFAPHLVSVSDRYHWDQNMPSLPFKESDAVIIGRVTDAQAHLSSDKTGVYSEFTIEICQVLKNDSHTPLPFPVIVAERTGGRVRFPSGRIGVMYVSNLGMPRVGRTYVLFLTHNFPYQVRRNEDYRILTGYELRDGLVIPLETSGVVNFDAHRGKDQATFLADLQAALENSIK
jgi:hypothetical protein